MSAGKIVITDRISIIDLQNILIKTINLIYLIAIIVVISIVFIDQFMRRMWRIKIDVASSENFLFIKIIKI